MGTTLTGTTPQDTYDSLIKVTDNGPISGTAKYLSDGLGNDSVLSLSTTLVGVGTATPSQKLSVLGGNLLVNNGTSPDSNSGIRIVAPISTTHYNWMIAAQQNISGGFELTPSSAVGGTTFSTPALSILGASGNVGIGTTAPDDTLHLNKSGATLYNAVHYTNPNSTASLYVGIAGSSVANGSLQNNAYVYNAAASAIVFATSDTERMRVLAGGGITFNGDTAAANALDDYEEGTWTMGISFGGGSTGITYSVNTGTYTKIGRQVTVNGLMVLTSKGSSSGNAKITGLPFTIPSSDTSYSSVSLRFSNVTFANQFQGFGLINSTTIDLEEITILGAVTVLSNSDFANDSGIILSFTYFV